MSVLPGQDLLDRRIAFLKRVPLFAHLKVENLRILAADFRPRLYEQGATIFRQDDHSREIYIVLTGKVRIYKLSLAGEETSIQIFSIGDLIGELAALDHQPRSAWVKAIDPCELLEMDGDLLLRRMHDMPELAISMTRLLVGKLRWMAEYAETVAQYTAPGRLLHILLFYSRQFGCETEAGKRCELDLSLSQTDLASMVGARREWVNRILKKWQKKGLIDYDAHRIVLLDIPRVIEERDRCLEANRQKQTW